MGNGLTTDVSTAADDSPGGHPRSSSPTSMQEIQHRWSSTHLDAAVALQEGASPTRLMATESFSPQRDVTHTIDVVDDSTPSNSNTTEIGSQSDPKLPSSTMVDSMLDFLNELREERRAQQRSLENSLLKIMEEAHMSMSLRLDQMEENLQSNLSSIAKNSQKEMIEKNAEFEELNDNHRKSTQVTLPSQGLDLKDNFSAATDASEIRLNTTVPDCSLATDSELRKIESTQLDTAKEVNKMETEVQLLKNNSTTNLDNSCCCIVPPCCTVPSTQRSNNMCDGSWNEKRLSWISQLPSQTSRFFQCFSRMQWIEFHPASDNLQKSTKKYFHLDTGPYTVQQISSQCDLFKVLLSVSGWTCFMRLSIDSLAESSSCQIQEENDITLPYYTQIASHRCSTLLLDPDKARESH